MLSLSNSEISLLMSHFWIKDGSPTSLAFNVMSVPLNACETGHIFFASSAFSRNTFSSIPRIVAPHQMVILLNALSIRICTAYHSSVLFFSFTPAALCVPSTAGTMFQSRHRFMYGKCLAILDSCLCLIFPSFCRCFSRSDYHFIKTWLR